MKLIETLGNSLLHFFWEGALLLLCAWIMLFALRNRPAQARYLACCAILALMALAPVLTAIVLYPREVPLPSLPPSMGTGVSVTHDPVVLPQKGIDEETLRLIVAGWFVGVAALSLRCVGGFLSLARLKRMGCQPVPESMQARFVALAEKMGVRKLPRLYVSSRVGVPTVIGAFRGVILLPASVVTGMPTAMLETVLAHELAHVLRYDFLVNAVQSVVEIVLFYHPAVWWLSNRIREERENCCDDLVLATFADRQTYALALTRVEELRMNPLALRANGGELISRIRRILGEKQMKTIASPLSVAVLIGTLALVPMLQSFADGSTTPVKKHVTTTHKKKQTTKAKAAIVRDHPKLNPPVIERDKPAANRPALAPPSLDVSPVGTPYASPYGANPPTKTKAQALPMPSKAMPAPSLNSSDSLPAASAKPSANAPLPTVAVDAGAAIPTGNTNIPPVVRSNDPGSLAEQLRSDIKECMEERTTLVRQYRSSDINLIGKKIELAGAKRALETAANDKDRDLAKSRIDEIQRTLDSLTESNDILQEHIKRLDAELDGLRARLEKVS